MRIDQLGDGDPELAVVGSIHGDEPCGAHAITLLCRLAEYVDGDAIDEAVDGCLDEGQGSEEAIGASGLLQALLGQAAKFRQPRLH